MAPQDRQDTLASPTKRSRLMGKMAIANLLCAPSEMAAPNYHFWTQGKQPALPILQPAAVVFSSVSRDLSTGSSSGSSLQTDSLASSTSRRRWTKDEDALLLTLVGEYGPRNWNDLAASFDQRSGRQVRLRYMNSLRQGLKSATEKAFTADEDARIMRLREQYGNKWSKIASLMHGRSDNSIKNRVHVLLRRQKKRKLEGEFR